MLCQICKKNIAVVMVNIMKDGHNKQMALCLNCAQKQGITLQNLMNQSGLNEKDIENLNQQMTDMLENMELENNPDALSQMMPPGLMEMLTGASPSGDQDDEDADEDADALMTMVDQQPASSQPSSGQAGQTSQTPPRRRTEKLKNLMKFGINMTEQASKGQIDNIIGRDAEIQRLMQILNRRTKNNPILLGEPGVGKTAIAEGLALRIARRDVPVKLLDKEVFWLDMTGLVAGTQFRGQFEGRMKAIINEVVSAGNVILVIDEVHNLVGAGDAQNSIQRRQYLKTRPRQGADSDYWHDDAGRISQIH